ncbi:fibronectin-like [Heteronotia binoei]|uniref:fibronectin-like n=1 Tax=Heteronotia binoei TaxID=13085 RepID=UPI002931AD7B|nr:fibronectin-like [Heteronotia binoei]
MNHFIDVRVGLSTGTLRYTCTDTTACVFPFIFDGKRYLSCTMDGTIDEKLWCATTDNFDKDSKWKHCSVQEYGGNSDGKPCIFPFVYKNRIFYTCTDEDRENGRFWCSTTSNFDLESQWSYCADTRLDANPKGPCVFPFLYNGTFYSSCTTDGISNKKLWCSLTDNYDVGLKWTYCEPSGPDESLESTPCVFPFIYKGKSYQSCTTDGWSDGTFWCATTSNYDADKKWKFCEVSGPDPDVESPPCSFPFIYKGKSYDTCTTEGMSDGKLWCATTSTYDVDKKWVYCNATGPDKSQEGPSCVFPFIYNGLNYSSCMDDGQIDGKLWCSTTSNYDIDKQWTFCTVTKTGCVFPFIYKEKSYQSCIPVDRTDGKAWCSTTPNYATSFKWRLCNESDCAFPFVFRGKTYHSCTTSGRIDGKFWCPLTSNPETDRMWLLCDDLGIAPKVD